MMWYQFQPYEAYINSGRIDEALALAAAVMQSDGGWHVEESHYYQGQAYEAAGRPTWPGPPTNAPWTLNRASAKLRRPWKN